MDDDNYSKRPIRRPLPSTRFASPPPRPRPLSFAEPSIRAITPPHSPSAHPPSFHSHSYSADYAAHPPSEPYDPYQQRGSVYQQTQQDEYGEVPLEGYGGEVRYEDAGGDFVEDRYGEYEEREELEEKRWSEAPSVYRAQEWGEDEEKGDKVDVSFDGPDWKEKEGLEEGSPTLFEGVFGAPPETAVLRRNKTKKLIKLTDGNLVIDFTIPTKLLENLPRKEGAEFTHTRVSYVTCGPEKFNQNSFALRPALYNRQTELFIVVTLYNEDEVLFCRTMHGVMKNIAHLCTRNKSKTWGKDGWKKVVVCIVADGRKKVHPRVLDCLSALGVYQDGMAKNVVKDKKVEAHVYEYTTQYSLNPDLKLQSLEKGIVPTQIMFCLKEENAKKLNSHRWALQAFAPQLDPNIVILIDVGTKPGPKSLYFLWKAFDLNSNIAGAAGEICAMKGKAWMGLLNPLVAAQNFEYKMSNILDKPTESVFGYITVLPGAFSAYRYIALQNDALGHGPLASYFKGEKLEGADADVFTSNMFLAEDRILCWELVAKAGHSWVLKFVKSAQGETDVPDTIVEFISQRRRWLNGSFFAGTYALTHTFQLLRTEHSFGRKVALFVQAIYNTVTLLFSWFGLANYWIFYMVLTSSLEDPSFGLSYINIINTIMQYCYKGTVVACFLFSMGNRPQGLVLPRLSRFALLMLCAVPSMTAVVLFSITTAYMLAAAGFCIFRAVKGSTDSLIYAQIIISLLATYGCYVLSSILALDPWHIVTSMGQYMLLAPFYINLLNIYAFSNLHDFSWGTKEQTTHEVDLGVAASAGKDVVDILLPSEQADIDGAYAEALRMLRTRPLILAPPKSDAQKKASTMDYYQNVRTNVLLAWCLSNALLVCTILQGDYASTFSEGGGNGRTQIYLVIVLIFVALMSLIRFVGSTAYLVIRLISG